MNSVLISNIDSVHGTNYVAFAGFTSGPDNSFDGQKVQEYRNRDKKLFNRDKK